MQLQCIDFFAGVQREIIGFCYGNRGLFHIFHRVFHRAPWENL